jgi:MFS family permease
MLASTDWSVRVARSSIWRGRTFTLLFASTTASSIGSAISSLVLPLVAIDVLGASDTEVGLLRSMQWVPFLFLAVPVGLLVDRRSRRTMMLTSDLVRAALLTCVVALAFTGSLVFPALLALALLGGCCAVAYELSFLSAMPDIVEKRNLQSANRATELAQSGSSTLGPLLAGVLIAAWTTAGALLVSVAGYALSFALLLSNTWTARPSRGGSERQSLRTVLLAGMRFVAGNPLVAPLVAHLAIKNVCLQAFQTAILVFMTQQLDLSAAWVGAVLAAQGVGFLVGAAVSPRAGRRIGIGTVLIASSVTGGFGMVVVAGAIVLPGSGAFLPAVGAFCVGSGMGLFNLQSIAVRQAVTPAGLLGRVNAAVKLASYTAMAIGAFLGGYFSTLTTPTLVIVISGAGSLLATLVLLSQPSREMRDLPTEQE